MEKGKRSGGLGTTLVLALLVVVLSVGLGLGLSRYGGSLPVVGWLFGEGRSQTTTGPVVVEGIQKLDRLDTVRLTESVIVTKETDGPELRRLLTGEELVLLAVGEVEAGVDLSDISESDVRVEGEGVEIRLPEPQISSVSLDEDKTRLYDRDQGLLNLRPDDALVEEARRDARDELLAAARRNDILATADLNAQDTVRTFLTTLGYEEVRFE
ncbi:MAG: DUF4230 domain-containing protein [Rubrobacteraceae bacterium]